MTHASSCTLSAKPTVLSGSGTFTCSETTPVFQTLKFPENTSSTAVFYKITLKASGAGGTANEATQTIKVSVAPGAGGLPPLSGVKAVVGDGTGFTFCALLASGGVDCWGDGSDGQLGNGATDTESAWPVQVEGVGGTGILSGVTSLTGDNETFCALLTSDGIDCWGAGIDGELGNGSFTTSATPVQVEGVGGTGTLSRVASLTGTDGTLCALLTSGKVDCWGDGFFGQLGNGIFYTKPDLGSATPVHVKGVGGTGILSGVTSVTDGFDFFCALLTSGGVDCWGRGDDGELGNGSFTGSDTPVRVEGVGGSGNLGGVASLTEATDDYCALLTSGGLDCWGYGIDGELGDEVIYGASPIGRNTPDQVAGVGGIGTLSGVASLTGGEGSDTFCALFTSSGVDCWGLNNFGQVGSGSAAEQIVTPVQVSY